MLLIEAEYRTLQGPALIVTDPEDQPAATIRIRWPLGLPEAMAAWTLTDAQTAELVLPAWLLPTAGDGAVCPCGNDPGCAGCGGSGVFRGGRTAVTVYTLTEQDMSACAVTEAGCEPLRVVGGLVYELFRRAQASRKTRRKAERLDLVLLALAATSGHVTVGDWQ